VYDGRVGVRLASLLLVAVASAGCDLVFKVDTGGPPLDDGNKVDGPILTGFDEDGDGTDNAIDNCPGISNDQTDSDTDGVGDLCDFVLGRADRIVAKYFFDDAADLDAFTNAGWTPVQGGLQASTAVPATLATNITLPDASVTIEVGFSVQEEGTNLSQTGVAVDGAAGHRCFVQDSDGTDGGQLSFMTIEHPTGMTRVGIPELLVGTHYHLRLTRDPPGGNDVTCRLDGFSAPTTYGQTAIPGQAVVFNSDVAAEIQYVVLYGVK
jgi:hypothetical protein